MTISKSMGEFEATDIKIFEKGQNVTDDALNRFMITQLGEHLS